jgi:hypothetical protein
MSHQCLVYKHFLKDNLKVARQMVHEKLSQKSPSQKRAGGVAQGVSPEFKLQYCKKISKLGMVGHAYNLRHR